MKPEEKWEGENCLSEGDPVQGLCTCNMEGRLVWYVRSGISSDIMPESAHEERS